MFQRKFERTFIDTPVVKGAGTYGEKRDVGVKSPNQHFENFIYFVVKTAFGNHLMYNRDSNQEEGIQHVF